MKHLGSAQKHSEHDSIINQMTMKKNENELS